MPENYIMTWFYAEQSGEESFYPQVAELSSSQKFQEVYWRCVVSQFASSIRNNPGCKHIFFTNVPKDFLPIVDGVRLGDFMQKHDIEVVNLDLAYPTPENFYHEWRSQFYVFGIFDWIIANHSNDDNVYLLLDSDCAWVRSGEKLTAETRQAGTLIYEIPYTEDHVAQGLTRLDMKDIYEEMLGKEIDIVPPYIGGEIQCFDLKTMKLLMKDYPEVWEQTLQRHFEGKKKFTNEAFVLSYLFFKNGFVEDTLHTYIRRIWTVDHHYTAEKADLDLTIWHLPTEKKYGFKRMFDDIMNPASRFYSIQPGSNEWIMYCAELMQIPERSLARKIKSQLREVKNRLQYALKG